MREITHSFSWASNIGRRYLEGLAKLKFDVCEILDISKDSLICEKKFLNFENEDFSNVNFTDSVEKSMVISISR